eukprot:307924-Chlamydomonas_euryale.AAC.13
MRPQPHPPNRSSTPTHLRSFQPRRGGRVHAHVTRLFFCAACVEHFAIARRRARPGWTAGGAEAVQMWRRAAKLQGRASLGRPLTSRAAGRAAAFCCTENILNWLANWLPWDCVRGRRGSKRRGVGGVGGGEGPRWLCAPAGCVDLESHRCLLACPPRGQSSAYARTTDGRRTSSPDVCAELREDRGPVEEPALPLPPPPSTQRGRRYGRVCASTNRTTGGVSSATARPVPPAPRGPPDADPTVIVIKQRTGRDRRHRREPLSAPPPPLPLPSPPPPPPLSLPLPFPPSTRTGHRRVHGHPDGQRQSNAAAIIPGTPIQTSRHQHQPTSSQAKRGAARRSATQRSESQANLS